MVTLITRPGRFGKALNLNMLEYFFSIEYAGSGSLFEGLSIWQEKASDENVPFVKSKFLTEEGFSDKDYKYWRIQGIYPVISLSFAKVKEPDFPSARKRIGRTIRDLYNKYAYIADSECLNQAEKEDWPAVICG